MRNLILLLTLTIILIISGTHKQALTAEVKNKTQITIIGTVHEETDNYNSDSLVNILNEIHPDLILVECDTSYMTYDYKLKDDIKDEFTETRAITMYSENNSVELRPYDIPGRDDFLNDDNRRSYQNNFFSDINMMFLDGSFDKTAKNVFRRIQAALKLADSMSYRNPTYINSSKSIARIDTINYYTYIGLYDLIKESPELSKYKSYWKDEAGYWIKRNEVMTDNILKYKSLFEGKNIVVLCGFAHKNILKNGLINRSSGNDLIVKEFWEN